MKVFATLLRAPGPPAHSVLQTPGRDESLCHCPLVPGPREGRRCFKRLVAMKVFATMPALTEDTTNFMLQTPGCDESLCHLFVAIPVLHTLDASNAWLR